MVEFAPRALATGMGSVPHPDPRDALSFILGTFPDVPFWPQLPRRDFRENMYVQFSEDMVAVKIDQAHEWIGAVLSDELLADVESFYGRYLENDANLFAIGREYAAGLYALCDQRAAIDRAQIVKGQVTGPVSFGLKVVDQNLRPILYDDALRDVLVKHLARKAQWEEKFLRQPCARPLGKPSGEPDAAPALRTLIFVDEPSLALIGASVVALNRDQVVRDLEEVFSALDGLKGVHCCGNTDWSMLLETSVDVISFDAYNYAENLALFADGVKRFFLRGGALAWGIVPTVDEQITRETTESLVARLDAAIGLLVKKGIDRDLAYEHTLVTPACGLGTVSPASAERAMRLAREVSDAVRAREWAIAPPADSFLTGL